MKTGGYTYLVYLNLISIYCNYKFNKLLSVVCVMFMYRTWRLYFQVIMYVWQIYKPECRVHLWKDSIDGIDIINFIIYSGTMIYYYFNYELHYSYKTYKYWWKLFLKTNRRKLNYRAWCRNGYPYFSYSVSLN